jgi:hypothetical protein
MQTGVHKVLETGSEVYNVSDVRTEVYKWSGIGPGVCKVPDIISGL